jgi:hypothetical protein
MSSTTKSNTVASSTSVSNTDSSDDKDDSKKFSIKNTLYSVFNQSNIIILIMFLAIYLIIYVILGIFKTPAPEGNGWLSSRMFDIVVFGIIGIILIYKLFNNNNQKKESDFTSLLKSYSDYVDDKNSVFSVIMLALFFYVGIYFSGIPMDASKPYSISLFETGIWITFVICIIVYFCRIVLNISIVDLFHRAISGTWNVIPEKPVDDKDVTTDNDKSTDKDDNDKKDEKKGVPEVYNISNNLYTYDDAKSVCRAYGARLATYDDIEKAYNAGAEWCGYGWSANQMALFPTQKETWKKLQDSDNHKNDCGRPGINGGYMANPNLRFGVNCYGVKPAPKQVEKDIMASKQNQIVPRNKEDILLDQKVQFWKDNGDKIVRLSSFNLDKWSEY